MHVWSTVQCTPGLGYELLWQWIPFFYLQIILNFPNEQKKCVCLRPHGRSVNFYGDRNQFEV